MADKIPLIRITSIRKAVARVEIQGVQYEVYRLDGNGYQLLLELEGLQGIVFGGVTGKKAQSTAAKNSRRLVELTYELAQLALPKAPESAIRSLQPAEAALVVASANADIEKLKMLQREIERRRLGKPEGNARGPRPPRRR